MDPEILGILLGAVGGAAIGIERQWSGHASGPDGHFAGIRTCTLLGGLAAVAGWLWNQGYESPAIVILVGAIALILAAYIAVSRKDLDGTTEVATLIVVAAGLLAGLGYWELSSGIVATTALLLIEKSRLHSLVETIPGVGLRAAFRFALMALVILPLLPEGPFGPRGSIRPQQLWMLVLFFSGINYVAYVVRSFIGAERGYVWTGGLGGMISSTNVTLTFSRASKTNRSHSAATGLALGVIAANTILYLRVLGTVAVLNRDLGLTVVPYLLLPAAAGAAVMWWGLRGTANASVKRSASSETSAGEEDADLKHPLQVTSALQMAALFQVVLFLITLVQDRFGEAGLVASGAVLGLTDVDSLVISMARVASVDQLQTAAAAILVGIVSNTALKLGITLVIGKHDFRRMAATGLGILAATTIAPLVWLWTR